MALISLRTYINPGGVTFDAAKTDRWFAEDALELKKALQDGVASIKTEGIEVTTGSAGIGVAAPKTKLHSSVSTILGVANAANADADLGAGEVNIWVDEANNALNFKVKYSDGITVKSGSVALA